MDLPLLALAGLGAIAAAVAAVVGGRRLASGKVNTTEASRLWDEGGTYREELRAEVADLKAEVLEVRARVDELRNLNTELRIENAQLRTELETERARHA